MKNINTNKLNLTIMTQTIISEQKNVRLSFISNNAGTYYALASKNYKGEWIRRYQYNPTSIGFQKALLAYYRLILCEIDADTIMDIDNDIINNL